MSGVSLYVRIVRRLTLVIMAATLSTACFGMDLVRDGQAMATIVVAPDAPAMVRFAATELQAYVAKATGAEMPIAEAEPAEGALIFVGESDGTRQRGLSVDALQPDGFSIVCRDNWLALFGRESEPVYARSHPFRATESFSPATGISRYGETGALYAVYELLREQMGVRWFMPGELGEVVPRHETVTVGELDISKAPDFEYRFLYHADLRVDDEDALWYRRAGYGAPKPVWINHSFHHFNKYRDTHPEYYALLPDGSRDFDVTGSPPGSFCLSEPGVAQQFIADIRQYFEENPDQQLYPVMPSDGYSRICECPACQAQINDGPESGKYSDYVWRFVNTVAEGVYETHPDKLIGCCAYSYYLDPPVNMDEFSPNVAVMIATAPRARGMTDTYREFVEAWSEKAAVLYRWEYYLYGLNDRTVQGLPMLFARNIAEDLRLLKGKSAGEMIEAESWRARTDDERRMHFPGMTHLNLYITGKLLWDADRDLDALLEDYYDKFYGPGRKAMKSFWTLAERLWAEKNAEDAPELFDVYSEARIDQMLGYLHQARRLCRPGSAERERVELLLSELSPVKERLRNTRVTGNIEAIVPRVDAAPVVDGVLDDETWQQAARIDMVGLTGEPAEPPTDGWLAWDDENLYLAFSCSEPSTGTMRYRATERDGRTQPYIWDDDSIEVFINPYPVQDKMFYQFIVNARGTQWDQFSGSEEFGRDGYLWNSGYQSAAKIGDGEWTAEISIPLADIGVTDPAGNVLSANFYRNRVMPAGPAMQYSAWSPTLVFNHHRLERFGFIRFAEPQ